MGDYREPSLPDGFLPFAIDDAAAAAAVARTLSTERSVPTTFRDTAKVVALEAMWVPARLFHARVTGTWEGERGDERGGIDGSPTSDADYHWSSQSGAIDEPLVVVVQTAVALIGVVDEEKTAASLREEPNRDAPRLEATVSHDGAVALLAERASDAARWWARQRCGGDTDRNVTTNVQTMITTARAIWLPCYRGTYAWRDETHAFWIAAQTTDARVCLASKPSDATEVAARAALDAANKKENSRQMNRIAYIAIAPVAFIIVFYLVATLLQSLFR